MITTIKIIYSATMLLFSFALIGMALLADLHIVWDNARLAVFSLLPALGFAASFHIIYWNYDEMKALLLTSKFFSRSAMLGYAIAAIDLFIIVLFTL